MVFVADIKLFPKVSFGSDCKKLWEDLLSNREVEQQVTLTVRRCMEEKQRWLNRHEWALSCLLWHTVFEVRWVF